jgi:hypothetical protein
VCVLGYVYAYQNERIKLIFILFFVCMCLKWTRQRVSANSDLQNILAGRDTLSQRKQKRRFACFVLYLWLCGCVCVHIIWGGARREAGGYERFVIVFTFFRFSFILFLDGAIGSLFTILSSPCWTRVQCTTFFFTTENSISKWNLFSRIASFQVNAKYIKCSFFFKLLFRFHTIRKNGQKVIT